MCLAFIIYKVDDIQDEFHNIDHGPFCAFMQGGIVSSLVLLTDLTIGTLVNKGDASKQTESLVLCTCYSSLSTKGFTTTFKHLAFCYILKHTLVTTGRKGYPFL